MRPLNRLNDKRCTELLNEATSIQKEIHLSIMLLMADPDASGILDHVYIKIKANP
jgi:hypothetical protein